MLCTYVEISIILLMCCVLCLCLSCISIGFPLELCGAVCCALLYLNRCNNDLVVVGLRLGGVVLVVGWFFCVLG